MLDLTSKIHLIEALNRGDLPSTQTGKKNNYGLGTFWKEKCQCET